MPSATLLIEVERQRKGYASARAKLLLLESLPRYFMEASLAVGFVAIGLSSYFFGGRDSVIPALTVFSAAGFRLLPIVNRIQGLVLAVVGRISLSDAALQTAENSGRNLNKKSSISIGRIEGRIALKLESISYKYPGSTEPVIDDVSLDFIRGLQYAIVGPSGAGKTTLVEILLGLRTPTAGKIQLDLEGVVRAYVPQHTHVTTRSTLENVALEWSGSQIDIDLVKGALASAHLADSVPLGDLNEPIPGLSGGQAQRIGLARALYRNPSFLVLDEATNALDSSTEASITDTISALRGEVTVVVVAHRLSTIKDADMVIYLEKGKVQMTGSFAEVYRSVPAFAEQVDLGRFSIE
jgi:ABC-type bacteriocin/lantibiotic exporter with double-glycine peptidase domain